MISYGSKLSQMSDILRGVAKRQVSNYYYYIASFTPVPTMSVVQTGATGSLIENNKTTNDLQKYLTRQEWGSLI